MEENNVVADVENYSMKSLSKNKAFVLDPRTKLLLVLVLGMLIAVKVPLYIEIAKIVLLVTLFALDGRLRGAIKILIFFGLLFAFPYLPSSIKDFPFVNMVIAPLVFIVRVFSLPIIAANYMISSTPVGAMISSLEKLRLPMAVIIPLAVMVRFFPSLKESYRSIKNAMKMRGIGLNFVNVITKPLLTLEYVMVPLLATASTLSDELAAAAHTKGVDSPNEKVRYKGTRFTFYDLVLVILILAMLVQWFIGRFIG